jgi:hypothetical protein
MIGKLLNINFDLFFAILKNPNLRKDTRTVDVAMRTSPWMESLFQIKNAQARYSPAK